ncbi:MAG: AtpZ/AtpI family protein [Pseudomonadota bacterium]|nr:AtpZ/AtpI family protein [Pseudomonadota bacterium]
MSETGGWKRAWKATAYVSSLPISTIAGGALGAALDHLLGGGWVFTAILGLLGFAAGVLQLFRGLKKLSDDDDPLDHPP